MNNHSVSWNGELRDSNENVVGQVDPDGEVHDGWRKKGFVNDDRYVDEYGRDHGWIQRDYSDPIVDTATNVTVGLIGLLVVGGFWLVGKGVKAWRIRHENSTMQIPPQNEVDVWQRFAHNLKRD